MNDKRQVSTECGQALANKFKLDYLEASAKNGFNIQLVFTLLAESLSLAHQNDKSATSKAQEKTVKLKNYPKMSSSDHKLRDYRLKRRNESYSVETDASQEQSQNDTFCQC